jgi:hypothetical protein
LVFRYFAGKNNYKAADNGGRGHKETVQHFHARHRAGLKTDIVKPVKDNSSKNTSDAF